MGLTETEVKERNKREGVDKKDVTQHSTEEKA
jgi:hypothetical protein